MKKEILLQGIFILKNSDQKKVNPKKGKGSFKRQKSKIKV